MIKKLLQKKGETLVETLVSLMIAVLAIALLSSCIMAATTINHKSQELDEKYSAQLQEAEGMYGTPQPGEVTIVFGDGSYTNVDVTLYGNPDGMFGAYDYETEVEP